MKYFAIIVAGGNGKRMQNALPKQFRLLNGLPVLCHTIRAFHAAQHQPEILLVLNTALQDDWKAICVKYQFELPHTIVDGGEERFFSVKNALDRITESGIVAVHDAVRPLVTPALIDKIYEKAAIGSNAIAAIKPSESVRYQQNPINRDEVLLIQTPQAFETELLKKAYLKPYQLNFTDDASVAEADGNTIHFVEGERNNIKITWEEDLILASAILAGNTND